MAEKNEILSIILDGKSCAVDSGLTILEAAERHGVYIPTLCTHKDLAPFGACRMCVVEVGGIKGFPTACTTPVQDGMVVKTQTDGINELRREVLRLTLTQHTCGCLVCDESEECKEHSGTTRKVGVTTGCRTCPNDSHCDLQDVAKKIGLTEIVYPVYYRGLPIEKYDPFYDRDYNLCILCGRCVRICQDVRGADTLAFQRRGSRTIIGPAFGGTHFESGCEFCGDCVSVCPTGALSEKVRKWDGEPDREEVTTCPLCGVGCQVRLLVKDERVIGSLPADDRVPGDGELCVKGRFCLTELVNHHRRLKKPYVVRGEGKVEIAWDEAIDVAVKKLAGCAPEKFAMVVSPDCTNEDLYVAQKFTRVAMRSNNIDTSARLRYGAGFHAYLGLMTNAARLSDIREAGVILAVGLDTRFGRSVAGVEIRKAVKRGAKLVTIHPRAHNLALLAEEWLRAEPGLDHGYFESLLDAITMRRDGQTGSNEMDRELSRVARLLGEAAAPLILIGPDVLHYAHTPRLLGIIGELARAVGGRVLVLPAESNLVGSILMGAYAELLPGGFASSDKRRTADLEKIWRANLPNLSRRWTAESLGVHDGLDVLYLIGEVPRGERAPGEFVIYQNAFPPESAGQADLLLPSAVFSETDGTILNGEGSIRRMKKTVEPPGAALADWEILCRIARKMGVGGFDFTDVREIAEEISRLVDGFGGVGATGRERLLLPGVWPVDLAETDHAAGTPSRSPEQTAAKSSGNPDGVPSATYPFVLTASMQENVYKGFPISNWVAGAREIFADECVEMNPEDAARAGVEDGEEIVVSSTAFERKWRTRIVADQAERSLHVTLRPNGWLGPNPHYVNMRKCDV